jgi:hypothetical protein
MKRNEGADLIHDNVYACSTTRSRVDFNAEDRGYRAFLAPQDRGHAGSWIWTSENSTSTQSGE